MLRLPLQLARSIRLDAHPRRQQCVRPALRPERLRGRCAAHLLFPKRLEPPALRLAEDSLELRRARGSHALDVRARLVVLEPAAVHRDAGYRVLAGLYRKLAATLHPDAIQRAPEKLAPRLPGLGASGLRCRRRGRPAPRCARGT